MTVNSLPKLSNGPVLGGAMLVQEVKSLDWIGC